MLALFQQAARLRTLVAIGCARFQARVTPDFAPMPEQEIPDMQPEAFLGIEPDQQARTLAVELLARVALDSSDVPFTGDDPETWDEEDVAVPEIVSLGQLKGKIVDADASHLAVAVGAIEPGALVLWMRVQFDASEGTPMPAIGQVSAVQTEEPGVTLAFTVWLTHDDLAGPAAPKLGSDAERYPTLDLLETGQALLVQILCSEEAQ